jgi:hypothetical protein
MGLKHAALASGLVTALVVIAACSEDHVAPAAVPATAPPGTTPTGVLPSGGPPPPSEDAPQGVVGRVSIGGKTRDVTVTAYAPTGAVALGTAVTDAEGRFAIDLGAYVGNVRLVTSGGTFEDSGDGGTRPLPALRTRVPSAASDRLECTAQLSPLTELAAALSDSGVDWATAVAIVTYLAGGEDVLCTNPHDPGTPATNEAGVEAGLGVAAISTFASRRGVDLAAGIQALAVSLKAKDVSGADEFQNAVSSFMSGPSNKTGLTAATSTLMTFSRHPWENVTTTQPRLYMAKCGTSYVPSSSYPRTPKVVSCATPVTVAPVVAGPGPHPDGSRCGRTLSCVNDELHSCGGGDCIAAVVPATSSRVWYGCEWYTKRTLTPGCVGGAGLVAPDDIVLPKLDCNPDCDPRLELVLGKGRDIDGSLLMHRGVAYAGLYNAPFIEPVGVKFQSDLDHCPGRSDQACKHVLYASAPIGTGAAEDTITFLTTYGKQWTATFRYSLAANATTYCDIFTGECVTHASAPANPSGPPADCSPADQRRPGGSCIALVSSEVGTHCGSPTSFGIVVKNICAEQITERLCIDRTTGIPDCVQHGLLPNQTAPHYACASPGTWSHVAVFDKNRTCTVK